MRRREGKRLTAYYAVTFGLGRHCIVKRGRCRCVCNFLGWFRNFSLGKKFAARVSYELIGSSVNWLLFFFWIGYVVVDDWDWELKGIWKERVVAFFLRYRYYILVGVAWVMWQEYDKDNWSDPRSCTEWSPLEYRSDPTARATKSLLWNLFWAWLIQSSFSYPISQWSILVLTIAL